MPSPHPISSSTGTGPCGRSAEEDRAPSGWRATSAPGSRSRSRSSPARASARRVPRARWRRRRGSGTSAVSAPTTSAATAGTSTSRTSTCRAARCARHCARASSAIATPSRPPRRSSMRSPTRTVRGIVHRDVKPSNVLVEEGAAVSIRLLDFGLAQFDEADTLTAVGDVPGTLAYISPERLARRRCHTCERRLGRRGAALGVARRRAPVLGRSAARRSRRRSRPVRRRSERPGRIFRRRSPMPFRRRSPPSPSEAPDRRTARGRSPGCARLAAPRSDASRRGRGRSRAPKPESIRLPLERAARARRARGRHGRARGARCCRSGRPVSSCSWRSRPAPPRCARPASGSRSRSSCPCSRSATSRRRPRSPTRALALGWLAVCWRDARAGLLFVAGPLLASIGALALLPARGAARPRARRGARCRRSSACSPPPPSPAFAAHPLPLTGAVVPDLGIDGSTRVADVGAGARRRSAGQRRAPGRRRSSSRSRPRSSRRAPARARGGSRPSAWARSRLILARSPRRCRCLSIVLGTGAALRRSRGALAAERPLPLAREAALPAMSVLRTIESKIEGLFEGVFGRAFRTHVQPVELARKLAKEMDEHRSVSVSRVYVPERVHDLPLAAPTGSSSPLRGLARRRAAGVPHRARTPGGLRAADAAARAVRDRRRPRRRRVRHRDAGRAARGRSAVAPRAGRGAEPARSVSIPAGRRAAPAPSPSRLAPRRRRRR